ncbi:DUF4236 domain-containing protein [Anaerococcus sp. ENR1011]|uniref:DUF4236 domain-containing protein n=1 Tax=Anaerococcus groningensis TaxID=3115616 RepID=A0ABW9N055_9FIRM
MGIRYRKSINLGKGFRINMSKTGPGFSWGGKGFRITRTANGNIRGSAYIPGTGIGYQKDFGNPHKKITGNKNKPAKGKNESKDSIFYKSDIGSIHSSDMADVLAATNKNRTYKYTAIALIIIGLLLIIVNPLFAILAVLGVILAIYNKNNQTISLDYELSDDAKEELEVTNDLLKGIMESDAVWLVNELEEARAGDEERMRIIDRTPINFYKGTDEAIEANVDTYTLDAGKLKLIFLPDAIFIKQNGKLAAVSFKEIDINLATALFLEDSKIPNDATVLGKTYAHTNKDGSPDKRYKDNPEMTLVEYGVLSIFNHPGLELLIVFSDTVLDGE